MPVYSLSKLGNDDEKPKAKKGRSGWLGALLGKSGFDPLGIGSLGKEIGQAGVGLANLATSLAPGGQAAGAVWSQAGRGLGGSVLNTLSTPLAPLGDLNPVERLGDRLLGKDAVGDIFERAGQRGLASALFEDVGNLALGAGTAAGIARRAGNAATKAAVVGRATEKAARAGLGASTIERAATVGREAGEAGRYIGARSGAIRESGIRGRLLTDVARAEGRLAKAGGLPAATSARGTGRAFGVADTLAHPYLEAGRRAVRPLTRAAQAATLADKVVAPKTLEERALAAAEALPGSEGATDFYDAQRRLSAQEAAYENVHARAAGEEAAKGRVADRLEALGAKAPATGNVRDRLVANADAPIPEWAAKAVGDTGKLHRAQGALSKAEGYIRGFEGKQLLNETRRFMEAERRKLFFSPAVRSSQAAVNTLRDMGVDPVQASRLVGDQLMAELDNRNLLLAGRSLFPDNPVFEGMVQEAIGRKHLMTNDQLDAVRPHLDAALAEWEAAAGERRAMLLGSPERGMRGLEQSVDFDPLAFDPVDGLTASQQRMLNQKIREYETLKKSNTVEGRAAKQRERAVLGKKSALDKAVAELDRVHAQMTDAQRAVVEASLPQTLQTGRRAQTVARLTEIMDGGTYDPWTDTFVDAAVADASVGVVGEQIPRAVWDADPAAAFDNFIRKYDTVLNDGDARIGVWADGDVVYLDVAQTTAAGRRLSREQAAVLGMARGEKAIWDFAAEAEAWLPRDETTRAVASQHAAEVMKPSSQFNRFLNDVSRTRRQIAELQGQGEVKISAADWDDAVQRRMRIGATAVGTGRFPSLDAFYGRMAVESRKTQTDVAGAMLQVYLAKDIESAMRNLGPDWNAALAQVGDGGKQSLDWYFNAYDTIASRFPEEHVTQLPRKLDDGTWTMRPVSTRELLWSIMAVTSVDRAPLSNAHATFLGISQWSDFMRDMDPAKLADVLDEYTNAISDVRARRTKSGEPIKKFDKDDPQLLATELWREVGMAIPQIGRVNADVFDILTERLVGEWDTEWLFNRQHTGLPMTAKEAKAAGAGKVELPEGYEDIVDAARKGNEEAEGKIRDLYGSVGYAKIRNFYANMQAPHKNRGVTLDRVMAQAFGNGAEDWSGAIYDKVVGMMTGLADDLSQVYGTDILPHQVQALFWIAGKMRMHNAEIGRRQFVFSEAVSALDSLDAETAAAVFESGQDPISRWFDDEVAFADGPGKATIAERNQPGAGPFYQKVSTGEERTKIDNQRGEWDKRRAKVVEALRSGKRPAAEEALSSWFRYSTKEYGNIGEYFSDYPSGDPNIRGIGPTLVDSAARAKQTEMFGAPGTKVLPEADPNFTSPSGVPAEGFGPLSPEQLDVLGQRAAARWEGEDAVGMFQRLGDDLANGMTFLGDKTGRITERFFRSADPTTLLHEDAHMLRLILPQADIQKLLDAYPTRKITPPGQQAKRAAGLEGRFGPEGFEEWFAEQVVSYFNTQQAPAGLDSQFGRIRAALSEWWQAGGFDAGVAPEVMDVMNRWLDPVGVEDIGAPQLGRGLDVPAGNAAVYKFAAAEKARPGETRQQALKRGLKLGRDVQSSQDLAARVATAQAKVARMERELDTLPQQLADLELPIEARKRRQLERLEGGIETLRSKADNPKSLASVLPAHWMPLAGAVDELRDLAKQPGFEPLAEMLAEIPTNLTGFLEWAQRQGFDPTHVASIPESKVKAMVFGRFAPGDEAIVAGTRKQRRNPMPMDRSVEALMAAHLDVVREAQTNQFLQTVRDTMAVQIAEGTEIPQGWVPWDEVQRYMGVSTDDGVLKAVGPGAPRYMVPQPVAQMIRHNSKNYDFGVLRGIRKMTSPWRALVLTLSPRWYVNNAVGNMILATAAGVKPADWAKAWQSYRQGDHQGNWLSQRFGPGTESFGDAAAVTGDTNAVTMAATDSEVMGSSMKYGEARGAGQGRASAAKSANRRVVQRLAKANSVVDDIARTAVYFSEQAKGFTPEQAVQQASRALVDYNDLGPVERSLVRSVVPFYAWQKGILKVVGQMAIDHPARVALMYQLGNLNDEMFAELPEWYRQQIGVPGVGPVNVRALNPFADATSLLSPNGIASSMNPFLEGVARNALDAPATGYPEEYRVDELGRAMPFVNPIGSAFDVAEALPQLRAVGAGDASLAEGLGGFFGVPAVRGQDQLTAVTERYQKSQAKEAGLTPTQAGLTPPPEPAAHPLIQQLRRNLKEQLPKRPSLSQLG